MNKLLRVGLDSWVLHILRIRLVGTWICLYDKLGAWSRQGKEEWERKIGGEERAELSGTERPSGLLVTRSCCVCFVISSPPVGRREVKGGTAGKGKVGRWRRTDGACKVGDRGLASIGTKIEKIWRVGQCLTKYVSHFFRMNWQNVCSKNEKLMKNLKEREIKENLWCLWCMLKSDLAWVLLVIQSKLNNLLNGKYYEIGIHLYYITIM